MAVPVHIGGLHLCIRQTGRLPGGNAGGGFTHQCGIGWVYFVVTIQIRQRRTGRSRQGGAAQKERQCGSRRCDSQMLHIYIPRFTV